MDAVTRFSHGRHTPRLHWVVAAPGEGPVDWDRIVSEDEDGVRSGWARETSISRGGPVRGRRAV